MIAHIAIEVTVAHLTCLTGGAEPRKPNVLLIYTDDQGYGELGCYGGKEVATPHIDSIAANGVRFTQGYVSSPLCSPSRAGLMTGRAGSRYAHETNRMGPDGGLPLTETTLATRMKALGYATAIVGKWHLGDSPNHLPLQRGFDEFFGTIGNPESYFTPKGFIDSRLSPEVRNVQQEDFYTTDAYAARAAAWIEKQAERPWFLYLAFNAVHSPFEATQKYRQRVAHISDPNRQVFAAMLCALDEGVGLVLEKVRELGLEQDTLIFLISDNGAPNGREGNGPLRGGKHQVWEGGIRLPFLAQWKGKLPAGMTYENPVVQLDVMPTCIAAAGGEIDPAWKLDGVNLLPFLTGADKSQPHETLFWRIRGVWAVRHGDLKLVHGTPGDAGPELYDLAKDVGEEENLASLQPDKAKQLRALWDAWNSQQMEVATAKARKKTAAMAGAYESKSVDPGKSAKEGKPVRRIRPNKRNQTP